MNYQNLAYCRFLHIWMTFYFLNLISFCPTLSFYLTFVMHFFNLFNNISNGSKIYGIVISDVIILYFLNLYSFDLYVYDNILMFIFYNFLLHIYNKLYHDNINILTLHFEKLPQDDVLHKDENYLEYLIRVWGYVITFIFLHMPNYFVD